MAEMTRMMVKVDLQCERCCKKIKKILCKFPQIRDHIYDDKQNAVFITVVCCSPEKIRDKIICKGGDTVLGVEILPEKKPEPEKPKEPVKPKEPEKKPEKPKEPEKKPEKPKEPEKKPDEKKTDKPKDPEKKPDEKKTDKPKDPEKPKDAKPAPPPAPAPVPTPPQKAPEPAPKPTPAPAPTPTPAPAPAPAPPKPPQPVPGYPPMYPMVGVCWCPCYEGCGGGPCYCQGQGRPMMCYDGCGRPAYECQGGSRPFYGSRCEYFSEENATGCIVM